MIPEAIDTVYDEVAPTCLEEFAFISNVALDLVGAVTPWNSQLDMATWKALAGSSAVN